MTSKDMTIILGGRNGAGKTTLLQHLTSQETDNISADVVKDETILHFIDMPSIKDKSSFKSPQFQKLKEGLQVFVYCMPISPNSKFQDGNPEEMKALQDIFGEDIWKHCIIAFTYSNEAWNRICSKKDKESSKVAYKAYIEDYSKLFCGELRDKLDVKSKIKICGTSIIVPADTTDDSSSDDLLILALPAGDAPQDPVLPGVTSQEIGWIDILVNAILHKGQSVKSKISPLPNFVIQKNRISSSIWAVIAVQGAFMGYITSGKFRTVAAITGIMAVAWLVGQYYLL